MRALIAIVNFALAGIFALIVLGLGFNVEEIKEFILKANDFRLYVDNMSLGLKGYAKYSAVALFVAVIVLIPLFFANFKSKKA